MKSTVKKTLITILGCLGILGSSVVVTNVLGRTVNNTGLLVVTLPIKAMPIQSPMGNSITEVPDFGNVQGITAWGQIRRYDYLITVWVDGSEQAKSQIASMPDVFVEGYVSSTPGDTLLQEKVRPFM